MSRAHVRHTRRKRRQAKQAMRNKAAKPKHKLRSGRTGSAHARKTPPKVR